MEGDHFEMREGNIWEWREEIEKVRIREKYLRVWNCETKLDTLYEKIRFYFFKKRFDQLNPWANLTRLVGKNGLGLG